MHNLFDLLSFPVGKCLYLLQLIFLYNWLRVLGAAETPHIDQGVGSGKEMISLSPPPLRTVHTRHRVHGSSNRRTPRGALPLDARKIRCLRFFTVR